MLSVLYEDEWLVAVDKPSGLLVIPSPKGETDTLGARVNALLAERGTESAAAWPCHRIDRETSGVMLYAKGKAVQKLVMAAFEARTVAKAYLALVNGVPGKAAGVIDQPIEGQSAETRWKLLAAAADGSCSAVQVWPKTGRTNQIRIHFARMGHPLLGDAKFGVRKEFLRACPRTALHAWRLELAHPKGGAPLSIQAPIPADLMAVMAGAGLRW